MLMDVSSEMIHSLLPALMLSLGASVMMIGIIEGIAEATASVTKVFSGAISDYFRKRKIIVLLGYGLAAITKPIFPLATSMWWVFSARFIDRIGKGIRGAPRDALIADIAPSHLRGAAYGLRQSLDTVGAFVGPLLAVGLLMLYAGDLKSVMWWAVVPALLTVALLFFGVSEPDAPPLAQAAARLSWRDANQLSSRYWFIVTLGGVFTLARFSEAFLILRAQDVGLAVTFAPLIMIAMNVVYSLFAYPVGAAADRLAAKPILVIGLVVLVIADVVLAYATTWWMALLGAMLWGLHMAFTQGVLAKLVADTAPDSLRGTAFGVFNLVSGGALLLASVIAGALWHSFGATATFIAGAGFAVIACVGLVLYSTEISARHET
jgi:MFS family permease